jgi:uncharacterized protein (TIGR02597 family)
MSSSGPCSAAESYTPPAGYFAIPVKAASDNYISLPLVQKATGFATVSWAGRDRISIGGSRRFNAGQFGPKPGAWRASYVAEFVTGSLRGVSYDVLDNSADTLLLDTQGDNLTQHPRGAVGFGDIVRLRPLWTPSAVFGDTEESLQIDAKPDGSTSAGDTISLPDNAVIGLNKPPAIELSFIQNAGWRSSAGDQSTNRAEYPIFPGQPIKVRRSSAQDTTIITLGHVARGQQSIYVPDGGDDGNDVYVALLHPEPVSLGSSGLVPISTPTSGAFQPSTNAIFRSDELMAFEEESGFNPTPTKAFYFLAGRGWRQAGLPGWESGHSLILEPGRAYLLRRKAGSLGGDWIQEPVAAESP